MLLTRVLRLARGRPITGQPRCNRFDSRTCRSLVATRLSRRPHLRPRVNTMARGNTMTNHRQKHPSSSLCRFSSWIALPRRMADTSLLGRTIAAVITQADFNATGIYVTANEDPVKTVGVNTPTLPNTVGETLPVRFTALNGVPLMSCTVAVISTVSPA